ncbi:cytochrome d ubiquinol oxidase subunit II [Halalkalibacterium halodurans]|jgi:cytochrome d ubiquinol oxidase subunit II|uniref:Cytochrome d (Bd-type) ubiquinol oxidase subunit II n=2 Tax=Halalkalibacterium halodurans TaxID=86665 RepID=Q9KEH5_HALH5|nr:cytochrome d ubiquinol oxidase subunit II [Halalkalibacterium halodurans]MDY7221374.1 cytochrome d ubiquinol oxidase subunit II [Halalkalibacterium halodurans]MDY7240613.1 cytochrome d ubiquinol oxidase subunit II [Halalkalibacterium halodurans]MED3646378.1 cytochrome d ubiquinol oxidase subunit II [Halalkalibacterium halodurans]MED4080760.1 cytochrome d ubiquinol oxidase subunit II [Halalkalibacterium halodurans]MED4086217.1 cytochrome d ubiquinol oxidase subunit II [Halalkalibacterium hal
MNEVYIAIIIIWSFLFIYSIAGSIDFGAGFWAMFYLKRQETKAASIANRYLSPSWEVTNVFLVLLVIALVGFFPGAAASLGTLMIVPFCLVLFLLIIRSAFMVYSYSVQKYSNMLIVISGITGLLIPALLISILPAAIGGFIETVGDRQYILLNQLFTSPTFYTHIGFGLSTELFLSALLLSDYAREAQIESTFSVYRRNAIVLGPITLAFAVAAIFTLLPEAAWMVENMVNEWLLFSLSLFAFAIGYSALWWPSKKGEIGQPRVAVLLIVAQFGLASFAYGSAHMPYLLYPHLTIYDAFTNETMFYSLFIGYLIGMALLIPAFILFWWLFMKDKRYLRKDLTTDE